MTREEMAAQLEGLGFCRADSGDWQILKYVTDDYQGKGALEVFIEHHQIRILWLQKSGISYASEYDLWQGEDITTLIDQHISKWEEYIKKEVSH